MEREQEAQPPELERFDRLLNLITGSNDPGGWMEFPDRGLFVFWPRGQSTPYSPSIYYEPEKIYLRRLFLDTQSPYFKQEIFDSALENLSKIEQQFESAD